MPGDLLEVLMDLFRPSLAALLVGGYRLGDLKPEVAIRSMNKLQRNPSKTRPKARNRPFAATMPPHPPIKRQEME